MSLVDQRPAELPRSRACEALGLSRTGTYPRRRRHKPAATRRAQPRQLSGEEEQAVLDLATTERYQDASVRVIHATELNHGRPLPSVSTMMLRSAKSAETTMPSSIVQPASGTWATS